MKKLTAMVYDKPDSVGITINLKGKSYYWRGDINTRKGSIERLRKLKLDNIY